MRICPRCGRETQATARFCDRCGFGFAPAGGGPLPPTEQTIPAPLEVPPPGDPTGSSGGIPAEPVAARHSPTLKLGAPLGTPGPMDAPRAGEPTVPVRRDAQDVPPDATLSGAAFRSRREDGAEPPPAETTVGWLVVASPASGPPGALWPIQDGVTLVGRQAGSGRIRIDHADLAPTHGLFFHQAGRTWYLDLSSPAGSTVNGRRLPPLAGQEILDRDALDLGGLQLQFRALEALPGHHAP